MKTPVEFEISAPKAGSITYKFDIVDALHAAELYFSLYGEAKIVRLDTRGGVVFTSKEEIVAMRDGIVAKRLARMYPGYVASAA